MGEFSLVVFQPLHTTTASHERSELHYVCCKSSAIHVCLYRSIQDKLVDKVSEFSPYKDLGQRYYVLVAEFPTPRSQAPVKYQTFAQQESKVFPKTLVTYNNVDSTPVLGAITEYTSVRLWICVNHHPWHFRSFIPQSVAAVISDQQ